MNYSDHPKTAFTFNFRLSIFDLFKYPSYFVRPFYQFAQIFPVFFFQAALEFSQLRDVFIEYVKHIFPVLHEDRHPHGWITFG